MLGTWGLTSLVNDQRDAEVERKIDAMVLANPEEPEGPRVFPRDVLAEIQKNRKADMEYRKRHGVAPGDWQSDLEDIKRTMATNRAEFITAMDALNNTAKAIQGDRFTSDDMDEWITRARGKGLDLPDRKP